MEATTMSPPELPQDDARGEDYEELDPATRAAIQEAEAQFERGRARPWDGVREALRARFVKR
jgi:hypothetical protein